VRDVTTPPPKRKTSTGIIVLVVILAACPVMVAIIGIMAAIAIPSFIGYTRRSKTAEATSNLSELALRVESYRAEYGTYPTAAPTPLAPPCAVKEMWNPTDPGWAQIGFAPADPLAYSYEVEGNPMRYVIRARGDLDCDGTTSLFERSSDSPDPYIENELE